MSSRSSSVTGISRAMASRKASGSSSVPDGSVLWVVSLGVVEDDVAVVLAGAAVVVAVVVVPELEVQLATTSAAARAKQNREITSEIYRHPEENRMLWMAETAKDCILNRAACL